MPILIAFGHEKKVGKDTISKFLIQELRLKYKGIYVQKAGFADKLKKICFDLYSWAGLRSKDYYDENLNEKEKPLPKLGKSARQIWIEVGNKLREVYEHTWIDSLLLGSSADVLIISDLRFPNEANRILKHGGFTFKLERPEIKHTSDAADDALIGYSNWTEILLNNSDLTHLYDLAQYLMEKYFNDLSFIKR